LTNLGVGCPANSRSIDWALGAPLIKKCAILAARRTIDQCYTENYDECCAMLRGVTPGTPDWPGASEFTGAV